MSDAYPSRSDGYPSPGAPDGRAAPGDDDGGLLDTLFDVRMILQVYSSVSQTS